VRNTKTLLATITAVLTTAVPHSAGGAEPRVLVVNEARGFVHDSIGPTTRFIRRLGARSRRYEVVTLRSAAGLTRRRLRRADAVVFAHTSGELPLPDREALLRFVQRGGSFVGTHSASDTLHAWDGYTSLLGAEFLRHGALQPGRLLVTAGAHPITRGLPRSLTVTDEFYEFTAPLPRGTRVLVRLDAESVADERGADVPLVWTRRYGRGRVFYDALGHPAATWNRRAHRLLFARGLAWALRR
jgi:type 1 glutamine amidotransferase